MPNRPCWVEISTRSLEENFRFLTSLTGQDADLLAIVKADAYGHSLSACAPAAARAGAKWLGVTSVEEGVAARALCPNARILVIAGVFPGQGAALVSNRLTAVVWERWQLDEIENAAIENAARSAAAGAGSVAVHLEIDTGMSRQGASADGLEEVLGRFGVGSALRLEGVMTHLYGADEVDGVVNKEQLERMDAVLKQVHKAGLWPEILNIGNSAAVFSGLAKELGKIAREHSMRALMRPGLALYGLAPQFAPEESAPVAEARATTEACARLEEPGGECARGSGRHDGRLQRNLCGHRADAAGAGCRGLWRRARPQAWQSIQSSCKGRKSAARGSHQHGPVACST